MKQIYRLNVLKMAILTHAIVKNLKFSHLPYTLEGQMAGLVIK